MSAALWILSAALGAMSLWMLTHDRFWGPRP